MLAATSKICPKGLVTSETLEAVHAQLVGLPVKEKKFFKTREAVDYLFKDIHDAIVNKNYTIDDISQYFVSAGWVISRTSLKQFWRFFRLCMENYTDPQMISTKKNRREHEKLGVKRKKKLSSVLEDVVKNEDSNKTKILSDVSQNSVSYTNEKTNMSSDKNLQNNVTQSQNSAHFDLPADTEDL